MSRFYRVDLRVRLPYPFTEDRADSLAAFVNDVWEIQQWDVEPDGSFWGTGQDNLVGGEAALAEQLSRAVQAFADKDKAITEVTTTDIDAAPATTYRFDPDVPR